MSRSSSVGLSTFLMPRSFSLLPPVGLALTLGDQIAQAAVDVGGPGVRTDVVAFIGRDQAYVREANVGVVASLRDFKHNVSVLPLALVLHEVEVVVDNMPTDLFACNKFRDSDSATVHVSVVILKFTALVSPALNAFLPPSTNVVDRVEDFLARLVDRKRSGVVLITHLRISVCRLVTRSI